MGKIVLVVSPWIKHKVAVSGLAYWAKRLTIFPNDSPIGRHLEVGGCKIQMDSIST
jgi:hypothetical protein